MRLGQINFDLLLYIIIIYYQPRDTACDCISNELPNNVHCCLNPRFLCKLDNNCYRILNRQILSLIDGTMTYTVSVSLIKRRL
jgi:hypothetical protein